MYKTESVLGLIGSIFASVVAALALAGTILIAVFFDTIEPFLRDVINSNVSRFHLNVDIVLNAASGILVFIAVIAFIITVALVVLGFIGTAKLRKGDKGGGVLLIIAGAIAFLSAIGFIPSVLFLVGGIMAVSKKEPVTV